MGKKQKQKKTGASKQPKPGTSGAAEGDGKVQIPPSSLPSAIAEGSSVDNSDIDDMPELEDVSQQNNGESSSSAKPSSSEVVTLAARQSRGEKKARRLMSKLDLKPIENVARVTMRKNKNILLCIDRPDVYKCPHTDTVICFGEVRVEDISSQSTTQASERFTRSPLLNATLLQDMKASDPFGTVKPVDDDDEDDDAVLDAAEVDEKDIELVQMQASCSRKKAIRALLKNDNDVVNAIMALTVG